MFLFIYILRFLNIIFIWDHLVNIKLIHTTFYITYLVLFATCLILFSHKYTKHVFILVLHISGQLFVNISLIFLKIVLF